MDPSARILRAFSVHTALKEAQMRAAQIVAPRRIETVDVEEPDHGWYPEGALKIRTHLSAICGTYISSLKGAL